MPNPALSSQGQLRYHTVVYDAGMSGIKSSKWWTRTVIYPDFTVIAFVLAGILQIIAVAADVVSPLLGGIIIGIFFSTALHEVAMRYRVHKFGRV